MSYSDYLLIQIGAKVKSIRKRQNLKLGELAEQSGISIAMISKIENARVFPTFPTLIQLLKTLNVDLNEFFIDFRATDDFPGYIFRKAADYQAVEKEDSTGFHYFSVLNHTIERSSMEISILKLQTNAQRDKLSTSGFEYIYILQGEVEYQLGEKTFRMETGDSLFFDGNIPHVPHNKNGSEAMILVIYFIDL